jgi:acetyl esterase/lipase
MQMRLALKLIVALTATACYLNPAHAAVWQPPSGYSQTPIWPGRPPGVTESAGKQETLEIDRRNLVAGKPYEFISNVSVPTMTVYSPKKNSNGAAVVVFPGGGFQVLAIDLEGTEICDWVNANGMTCILLKYRVPRSAHYWEKTCNCAVTPKTPAALQDAQRTLRLVRYNAKTWGIDIHKIGVIGFSAGGYMVAQTSTLFNRKTYSPVDNVDGVSARPDFALAFYPGHLWRDSDNPKRFDPDMKVTSQASPTFILQATDDPVDNVENSLSYFRQLKNAHVKVELHLFAEGGHAFGLRSTDKPITHWPRLAEDWLRTLGVMK